MKFHAYCIGNRKDKFKMKIAIAGMGYVGFSLAVLLAQENPVCIMDVVEDKVKMFSHGTSPIHDSCIDEYMKKKSMQLTATTNSETAYSGAEYVIIAVPTNYDSEKNAFDTAIIDSVVNEIVQYAPNAVIVIKSTVPIGFTERLRTKYQKKDILFSPEFLREGKALYDNLYPSRIIVGTDLDDYILTEKAYTFASLLRNCAEKQNVDIQVIRYAEAEAVKLFANTYLAMRIGFFNELDSFAEANGLDSGAIIRGICLDPRIGEHYNNPSFGYGGYCLPKDTRQLLSNYDGVPQALMTAIVDSNKHRKTFIAKQICQKLKMISSDESHCPVVGIYRLTMKSGSDNFRCSAIFDVMEYLRQNSVPMLLYEPFLEAGQSVEGCRRIDDLDQFKRYSSVIIANRFDNLLVDVKDKVYTRDLFGRD